MNKMDWSRMPASSRQEKLNPVFRKIDKQLKERKGGVILLHDLLPRNVQYTEELIGYLKKMDIVL